MKPEHNSELFHLTNVVKRHHVHKYLGNAGTFVTYITEVM